MFKRGLPHKDSEGEAMYKDKATPEKEAALNQIRDQFIGTSGRNRAKRLLAALARFPIITFEAMRLLDVYHVPARVLQLRMAGHQILTHRQVMTAEAGATHRVGLYVLPRERTMHKALLENAQALSGRMPWLGIGPDLAALPMADLWGICRFLERLATEAQRGTAS
jgi:hypothetical protein